MVLHVLATIGALLAQSAPQPTSPVRLTPETQTAPADQAATRVDDVVVNADRALPSAVRSFVDEVAAPPSGRGIARWNNARQVCVGAVNFRRDAAQALIDRVSAVGESVGVITGEPGCKPDVLIIGASDGAALAQAMVTARPRLFLFRASGSNAGRAALDRFKFTDDPVRWWAISLPTDSWTGAPAVRVGSNPPPQIQVFAKSQMRGRIRDDLKRIMVVVDMSRAEGMNFDHLADYVAMVAFAQIDPDADTSGYATVLNLFDGQAASGGLTEWDRAYLRTLYEYRDERILPFRQAELMTEVLRTGPVADQSAAPPVLRPASLPGPR